MMGYLIEKISLRVLAVIGGVMVVNNFGLVRYVEHPLPTTERLRTVVASLILIPVVSSVALTKGFKKILVISAVVVMASLYALRALYVAD
jgi:hypothetical protein